jgi:hypothetical protein
LRREHFCRRHFEGRKGELRCCETGPMIRDLKSRMQMQGKVIQSRAHSARIGPANSWIDSKSYSLHEKKKPRSLGAGDSCLCGSVR